MLVCKGFDVGLKVWMELGSGIGGLGLWFRVQRKVVCCEFEVSSAGLSCSVL